MVRTKESSKDYLFLLKRISIYIFKYIEYLNIDTDIGREKGRDRLKVNIEYIHL